MSRFAGKIALVTGAGSGIGAAIVRRLVSDGAKTVIAADITNKQFDLEKELGSQVIGRDLNVTDEKSIKDCEQWLRQKHGRLDILCNNAGIGGELGLVHEQKLEVVDRVWDLNIRGAYMMLQMGLRMMSEQGSGSIVNTASIGGFRATPMSSPYIISKGASVMMTRVAALEYITKGIRVNAVAPGTIRTPIIDGAPEEFKAVLRSQVPQGRMGEAHEVASVVAFLADKDASHVTGQIWCVDGGRSAS